MDSKFEFYAFDLTYMHFFMNFRVSEHSFFNGMPLNVLKTGFGAKIQSGL